MRNEILHSRTLDLDIQRCQANLTGSIFELVLIGAARAREIAKKTPARENMNPAMEALLEIQEGKVGIHYLSKIR